MPRILEGGLIAEKLRVAIVVSRFNSFLCERLLEGALDCLTRHGCQDEDITVARVPGSFEIPLACQRFADSGKFDAVIALGVVIRGGTPHFEYVASEVTKGVSQASWSSGVPVTFGVLTTDTVEQAIERAGTKMGNKGAEAAIAAIEMVNLLKQVDADVQPS